VKRVLAFAKYGPAAASTRQRLLQYLPALADAGFEVEVRALLDDDYVRALAGGPAYPRGGIVQAYARRFGELRLAPKFDLLWVYAELFPYLPAPFERLAVKSGRPVVYDFDDAFFHEHEKSMLLRDKLRPLITAAAAVCAGNEYLAAYARRWSDRVTVVPTVVDTQRYRPANSVRAEAPVIGWIGSPSTWLFVRPMLPLIADLCGKTGARFLAVGAGEAAARDRFDGLELRPWAEDREFADIQSMDVGIMPLSDEPWARGKCGYKLIQYMACGLPVIASPVGVNKAIVEIGVNGFLAATDEEWCKALSALIGDADLRGRLGEKGRARVVEHYSLAVHAPRVVELFRSAAA
jgi:glycosyltransferase involved in cell wall biosynthesis